MAVRRVTKVVVDRLPISGVVWDADVRGFGVRRQQRDASYVLKVRVGSRQRFLTIGRHGAPWTPETARREARRLLGEIAAGRDPADARANRKSSPIFSEFADRYLSEHVLVSKKPRSAAEDRRNLARHILRTFGRRMITCSTWRSVGVCALPAPIRASTSPNIRSAHGKECFRRRS